MRKGAIALITAGIITAMLCSCGKTESEKETMKETDKIEVTGNAAEADKNIAGDAGDVTGIDKDEFASGIKKEESNTTDNPSDDPTIIPTASPTPTPVEVTTPTPIIINGEIEEKCPVSVTETRKDVKYGAFTHGTYYSETCGMERGYCILLPADYSTEKKYPVLYLLHGIFGNEYSFSQDASNKIKEIAGNMAADGYIEETIIVCPDMYAKTDIAQKPGFDAESCLPYDNFINDLVNDLMPHIENKYSVLIGRENTYLSGFSMGGRETLFITLKRPELFGYVCAISAAPGIVATTDRFMSHPGQMKESEVKIAEDAAAPEVLIVCCGSKDSVVGQYPKSYHELLETNGTEHIWYEIPGADHDNNAIKSGLYNLFKQIAYKKQ